MDGSFRRAADESAPTAELEFRSSPSATSCLITSRSPRPIAWKRASSFFLGPGANRIQAPKPMIPIHATNRATITGGMAEKWDIESQSARKFNCGKLDQSTEMSLINSFRWVQLPLPATNFREAIRPPDCKTGVIKQGRKRRAGALPALPTIFRFAKNAAPKPKAKAGHFGLVAQLAERPVVCGRVLRVQIPSSPPSFFRSVAQPLERRAWDPEAAGGSPAVPTSLHSPSFDSASHFIAQSDNSSPSGCYPECVGAIPT